MGAVAPEPKAFDRIFMGGLNGPQVNNKGT